MLQPVLVTQLLNNEGVSLRKHIHQLVVYFALAQSSHMLTLYRMRRTYYTTDW